MKVIPLACSLSLMVIACKGKTTESAPQASPPQPAAKAVATETPPPVESSAPAKPTAAETGKLPTEARVKAACAAVNGKPAEPNLCTHKPLEVEGLVLWQVDRTKLDKSEESEYRDYYLADAKGTLLGFLDVHWRTDEFEYSEIKAISARETAAPDKGKQAVVVAIQSESYMVEGGAGSTWKNTLEVICELPLKPAAECFRLVTHATEEIDSMDHNSKGTRKWEWKLKPGFALEYKLVKEEGEFEDSGFEEESGQVIGRVHQAERRALTLDRSKTE